MVKALVLAHETGAIDNAALRAVTGLDTLGASQILRRLTVTHRLLEKGSAGSSTHYTLAASFAGTRIEGDLFAGHLDVNTHNLGSNASNLDGNTNDFGAKASDQDSNVDQLPSSLVDEIALLTSKARKDKLWPVLLKLCELRPFSADQIADVLKRSNSSSLKANHLKPMRDEGLITYVHPEVINHPDQAYVITAAGLQWLHALSTKLY